MKECHPLNRKQGKVGQEFLDESPMQSDELKMEIAYGERRGLTHMLAKYIRIGQMFTHNAAAGMSI
jgi:hypothetical protein